MANPYAPQNHHRYGLAADTDNSETPRPPKQKRFQSEAVDNVASQLVAPSDIFTQYLRGSAPQPQPSKN
ncbi:MAG: hypothetical protein LQ341_007692, partial [Variospora aurantia]